MFWLLFLVFLATCFTAGATGAMFPPGGWYRALNKPTWTPPDWLFPVAWTTLYLCIALAAARVTGKPGSGFAMAVFALQIALNTLWSPVFFGLRRLGTAMLVLVVLWVAVALTLISFWSVDWFAGLLFVPYLVWVSVAGALNWSVWRMNPSVEPLQLAD